MTPEIIAELKQLDSDISDYTQTIQSIGFDGLEKFDIIKLLNQEEVLENTCYGINEQFNLISLADLSTVSFNKYSRLLQYDSLIGATFIPNKSIRIEGLRAYQFFNIGDTISSLVSIQEEIDRQKKLNNTSEVARLTELAKTQTYIESSNTITSKKYVVKNNKHYTLLNINNAVTSGGAIAKNKHDCDVLLIFKTDYLTNDNGSISNFNKWSFVVNNDDILSNSAPYADYSSIGEGTYGTGSFSVRPKLFSSTYQKNKLKNIDSKVNSKKIDRLSNINIQIFDKDQNRVLETPISTIGYGYSLSLIHI